MKFRILSCLLVLVFGLAILPLPAFAFDDITNATSVNGGDYTTSTALAAKLDAVFSGDIDLYTNAACTSEMSAPLGSSPMTGSRQYWVKSNATGNTCSGWQCYIYANAVYNKLFNEWVGHGASYSHSKNVLTGGASVSYTQFANAGIKCGAYIRTTANADGTYNGSVGHSMILLSYDAQSITYIAGNDDGNGLIRILEQSWSEFNRGQLSGKSRYLCHVVQPTEEYYTSLYDVVTTYTVTFDANGGTDAPAAQEKVHGVALTLPTAVPAREGYTFLGWSPYAEPPEGAVFYQPGGECRVNYSLTLYAAWKADSYTVTFDANGGTDAPAAQEKVHGVALTLPTAVPAREGYTFLGWSPYAEPPEGAVFYQPGGSCHVNYSTILYAAWEPVVYTVSYDVSGGNEEIPTQNKRYEEPLTLSGVVPSKEGYTFVGWATETDGEQQIYQPGDEYTANVSALLVAVWEKVNMPGDVDGDGDITSTDARLTLQYYAGKIGESSLDLAVADVDGDGGITSTDARLILQYYAGKITAFPAA